MKELSLQNSKLNALVDDEDCERLSNYKWYIQNNGRIGRVERHFGRSINTSLACEILQKFDLMFDHKDRNYLNNTKENLRACNSSQNMANSGKRINTKSIFKGVSWHSKSKRWIARCIKNGVAYHLGCFMYEYDAAKAYNIKAKQLFGEFAHLNSV